MAQHRGGLIVVGSINVDLIVGVSRLPLAGETVMGDRFVQQNGGKSANQAVAASRAGAAVTMVGAVGADELGRTALAGLADAGVDVRHCRVLEGEGQHTGLALIVVDAQGENQIAVASGANGAIDAAMVEAELAGVEATQASICLLGFEIGDVAVLAAAHWAHRHRVGIVLNPAPARPISDELLALGPILTPNEHEAQELSGEADSTTAAASLSARTAAPVVVTLGSAGALLHQHGEAVHLPAYPVEPLDTTGAGDALNGILAGELARGAPLSTALRWAMVGAALKTTRRGAQAGLPTRATIAEHVDRSSATGLPIT